MPQGEGSINIPAILMVNLMGLIVLFAIAIGTDWRSVRRTNTVKALLFMTVSIALACIMEPLAYWQDGTNQAIGYLLNTLIYFIHCNLSVGWLMMVASHLDVKLSKLRKCLLGGYVIVSLLVLIANLFVPIVFSIDAQGVYTRSWRYFYLLAVGLLVAFDGVYIAYRAKRRSSNIKFFPVWAFLVPALLGRLIQTLWYGMSTAVPFLAISVGCCALCLQNERLHRDSHTNLFNRSYLSALEVSLSKRATHAYTAIFIDEIGRAHV